LCTEHSVMDNNFKNIPKSFRIGQLWNMWECKFKVCKSVHHHIIQINQPTRRNNFSRLLIDVYLQLNMFWASSRPSSGAQQLQ
jgi:hypothetical protein